MRPPCGCASSPRPPLTRAPHHTSLGRSSRSPRVSTHTPVAMSSLCRLHRHAASPIDHAHYPNLQQCHLAPWKLHVHYPAPTPHSSASPRLGAQRALDGAASARLPSRRPTAVVTHTHAETRRARPSLSRVSPEHPRVDTKGTRSGSRYAHGSGGRGAHALGCATTAVRTTCGMPLISAICEADHPLVPPGVVMSCWIMVPGEKLEGEREPNPLPTLSAFW